MNPCGPGFQIVVFITEPTNIDAAVKPSTTVGMASTYSATIFISGAWIFLPRYSGVRPTMRPAMNTDRIAMMSRPLRPTPTPPGLTSPSIMWLSATPPPSGVMLSCIELTEPFDVPVVDAGPQPGRRRSRSGSPCPPCCRRACVAVTAWLAPRLGELRVAVALEAPSPPATCRTRR